MSITILAFVEPTTQIISQIQKEYPSEEIKIFKRSQINSSISQFVRQLRIPETVAFYILCNSIKITSDRAYFLGLLFFCRVKKKLLIDLAGCKENYSFTLFLTKAIPRIIQGIVLSLSALLLSLITLQILKRKIFVKYLRVEPINNSAKNDKARKKCIAYFWPGLPDSNFNYKVGGEISHIVGFFTGLKNLGYKPYLISARPIIHDRFDASNDVLDERTFPPWPGEIRDIAYNWTLFFKTRKCIHKLRPFLIYHRTITFSFIGVLISIFYRIPLIVEINTSEAWKADNWGNLRFTNLAKMAEDICILYASKVAVVSDEVRKFFVRQGISSDKIVVNPNGVDPLVFAPKGRKGSILQNIDLSNKIVVGFIGSFNRYHGVITLAKSIKLVQKAIGNMHFIIIGDGRLRSKFETIIASDNVCSSVTMTGKVTHEEVPNLLNACDILVSPHQNMIDGSPFFGSPTKLFEYMAMAKGIVASNVGQLGQVLQHEKTALLVKPEDPKALAKAISRLSKDRILRETLGQKAREHVIAYYTWEKNAQRVLESFFGD